MFTAMILALTVTTSNSGVRPVVSTNEHVAGCVPARVDLRAAERDNHPPRPALGSRPGAPPLRTGGPIAVSVDRGTGEETFVDVSALPIFHAPQPVNPIPVGSEETRSRSWAGDLARIVSSTFPWSAQVRIVYTDTQGSFHLGSGTMIDPYHVVTAGHCVHEGAGGTWMPSVKVYPAWDGDDDAFGNADWASLTTFSGWTLNSDPDQDIALIRCDRPVGLLTGWLYLSYGLDSDFSSSNLFNMAGYPDNFSCYTGSPNQLFYGFGSFDTVNAAQLSSGVGWSCDATGTDGAGVYKIVGTNRYVIGVQRAHSTFLGRSYVKRTTASEYNYFAGFMPGAYPATGPRFVPMNVKATHAGSSVISGTALTSMTYSLGNASFNDHGPTTLDVKVYLSTNDLISVTDTLLQTHSFQYVFDGLTTVDVDVQVPPTIPQSVQDGSYYLGVIVTPRDGSTGSRSSDRSDAFPIVVDHCETRYDLFGQGLAGSSGFVPVLYGVDGGCGNAAHELRVAGGLGGTFGVLWVGFGTLDLFPVFGGHYYIDPSAGSYTFPIRLGGPAGIPGAGALDVPGGNIAKFAPLDLFIQCGFADPAAPAGISLTNGLSLQIQ